MRCTSFALLIGAVLVFVALPLSATPAPLPLFNECPHEGQAQGCSFLLVLGHGSANLLSDPNVPDVDNQEDILVGIKNDSGSYMNLDGYKGPNDIFSSICLTVALKMGKALISLSRTGRIPGTDTATRETTIPAIWA